MHAASDRKAETVGQCLMDIIWHYGVPSRIVHDRAPEFLSDVLQLGDSRNQSVTNFRWSPTNKWSSRTF